MGTRMFTCGSGTISTTNSSVHSLAERGCIIQRASYSVQRKVHVPSNKESGVVHQAPTRSTQHAEVIVRCAACSMQQGPGRRTRKPQGAGPCIRRPSVGQPVLRRNHVVIERLGSVRTEQSRCSSAARLKCGQRVKRMMSGTANGGSTRRWQSIARMRVHADGGLGSAVSLCRTSGRSRRTIASGNLAADLVDFEPNFMVLQDEYSCSEQFRHGRKREWRQASGHRCCTSRRVRYLRRG